MASLTVDFTKYVDFPLINHKFSVYICTYVDGARILRDIPKMKALDPWALRYDPGWGFGNDERMNSPRELDAPQIAGSPDQVEITFDTYDKIVGKVTGEDVRMMFVQAYNPIILQPEEGEIESGNEMLGMRSKWNTVPADMRVWQEINERFARHFKERAGNSRYYEIWNEPDLQPVFFVGSKEDYCEIYRHGSIGVKSADPSAKVGGPALANTSVNDPSVRDASDWAQMFLDFVEREKLSLDFFSYHNYAAPEYIVPVMRRVLADRPGMECVETIITEYNSYRPAARNFTVGGEIERHHLAWKLLRDFKYYLSQPDISGVYWAQFNDPEVFGEGVDRCGLISLDGRPKAAYYAWLLYARMPSDRVGVCFDDERLDGFASAEGDRYCLMCWNTSADTVPLTAVLEHVALREGEMTAYKIDAWHSSYIDNPLTDGLIPVLRAEIADGRYGDAGQVQIIDELLPQSVYYVEIKGRRCEAVPAPKVKDIRHRYYNRERSCYAEYDDNTASVYLGMGDTSGKSCVEVELEEKITEIEVEERDLCGSRGVYGIITGEEGMRRMYYAGPEDAAAEFMCETVLENQSLDIGELGREGGLYRLKEKSEKFTFFMSGFEPGSKVRIKLWR